MHKSIKEKENVCTFFHNFKVKVKVVEKLWLRNPHLVSGCFLLAISVIVIYATFEIKYLYICSKKECNDFSFMLIRDVLADEEKGFIRAR